MTTSIDAGALAASLQRLRDRPDDGAVLESSLQTIVDAGAELFGLTGSGLMLVDEHGALRYVTSTDPASRLLEEAQVATGQGPCVTSFVRDEPVATADVRVDDRWPELASRVVDGGVGAVLGVPVHLFGAAVGSLDVYCDSAHRWSSDQRDALARFAVVADAVIETAVRADQAGRLAHRLSHALDLRVPVERATGYLMARDHLDRPAALERLRRSARAGGCRLGDLAVALLRTGRLPDDPA